MFKDVRPFALLLSASLALGPGAALAEDSAAEPKPAASATAAETPAAATSAAPASPASASAPAPAAAPSTETPGTAAKSAETEAAKDAATAPATAASSSPASASPSSAAAASNAAPAQPPAVTGEAILAATRQWLSGYGETAKVNKDDITAVQAFYADRTGGPLWVEAAGFTARGKAAIEEVRKADDWGLEASAFQLPDLKASPSPEDLAEAEGKLTVELLKYARFAKGGRVDPKSLSRIIDLTPPVKDPKAVLTEIAAADAPDAYLRGLHPKYEQFELLREALLKARGPKVEEAPVDEALKVRLPESKTILKEGLDHPDVALLRKRLKVPAPSDDLETRFDAKLTDAVKAYQTERSLKVTGQLTTATRVSLNREAAPKEKREGGTDTLRIVLNMERWRWMPDDPGAVYVWNNVPEFYTRVLKGREEIFKEKIIVGMPAWATPTFSAKMEYVSFNPSWGMPDGIKARELAPRLKAAGGGFFLFGGGGGGSVIRAYGLNVYRDGRQVDPDSIDWSSADLRNYSFVQPAGGKNPLGVVKFRFPNKFDVYMHDTIQRELFSQSQRAFSHGCIRVQNPREFAAVLISEGNGMSLEQAARSAQGGGDITLKTQIPVYITYFTMTADKDGRVSSFGDIYGHDTKLSLALTGRSVSYGAPVETSSIEPDDGSPLSSGDGEGSTKKGGKKAKASKYAQPETLGDAISAIFSN